MSDIRQLTNPSTLSTNNASSAPSVLGVDGVDTFADMFSSNAKQFLIGEDDGNLDFNFSTEDGKDVDEDTIDAKIETEDSSNLKQEEVVPSTMYSKIQAMEQTIEKLSQVVIALASGSQHQPKDNQAEEPELDLSDTKSLVSMIKQSVQQAVTEATAGMGRDMQETKLRVDYANTVAKYGADFQTKLPSIGQLMQSDPKWTFESAYQFVNTLIPKVTKDSTASKAPVILDKQAITDRARSLRSEADQGQLRAETNGNGQVKSVRQALDLAFDQLSQSR